MNKDAVTVYSYVLRPPDEKRAVPRSAFPL